MLDKNINLLIVGDNYLSYLIALDYIQENKNVLLLSQSMKSYDDFHFSNCSLVELGSIKAWFHKHSDLFSIDFNKYIDYQSRVIKVDHSYLLLGRKSVKANLLELVRKCPDLFLARINDIRSITDEEDLELSRYLEKIGDDFFRFQTIQSFKQANFFEGAPKVLEELFLSFFSYLYNGSRSNDFGLSDALIYSLRSSYHQAFVGQIGKIEALHLFFSVISPNIKIEHKVLVKALKEFFVSSGGQLRDANIREWKFEKGRPWCVELNTFEGVVHPRHVLFIGSSPIDLPFQIEDREFYVNYVLKFHKTNEYFNQKVRIENYHAQYMGSRQPSWCSYQDNEYVYFIMPVLFQEAQKPDFLKDRLLKTLSKEEELSELIFDSIYLEDDVGIKQVSRSINIAQTVKLTYKQPGMKNIVIKNVELLGPLKCGALGLFSTLLEGKEFYRYHR